MMNPFTPGPTVSRSVTGTTANVAFGASGGMQVAVHSPATNAIAFIKFGASTVEAAVTDYPILPGTVEVLTIPPGATYVAAIGTTGTTLYFTRGDGE